MRRLNRELSNFSCQVEHSSTAISFISKLDIFFTSPGIQEVKQRKRNMSVREWLSQKGPSVSEPKERARQTMLLHAS